MSSQWSVEALCLWEFCIFIMVCEGCVSLGSHVFLCVVNGECHVFRAVFELEESFVL